MPKQTRIPSNIRCQSFLIGVLYLIRALSLYEDVIRRGRPYVYPTILMVQLYIIKSWMRIPSNNTLHYFLFIKCNNGSCRNHIKMGLYLQWFWNDLLSIVCNQPKATSHCPELFHFYMQYLRTLLDLLRNYQQNASFNQTDSSGHGITTKSFCRILKLTKPHMMSLIQS